MDWDKIARTMAACMFLIALGAACVAILLLVAKFVTWLAPFMKALSSWKLFCLFIASLIVLYCATYLLTYYDEKVNNPD